MFPIYVVPNFVHKILKMIYKIRFFHLILTRYGLADRNHVKHVIVGRAPNITYML